MRSALEVFEIVDGEVASSIKILRWIMMGVRCFLLTVHNTYRNIFHVQTVMYNLQTPEGIYHTGDTIDTNSTHYILRFTFPLFPAKPRRTQDSHNYNYSVTEL